MSEFYQAVYGITTNAQVVAAMTRAADEAGDLPLVVVAHMARTGSATAATQSTGATFTSRTTISATPTCGTR